MKLVMDPLGTTANIVEVDSLKRWSQTPPLHHLTDYSAIGEEQKHITSPFPYNPAINNKLILWNGDISCLSVDAIVNSTNEAMTERNPVSDRIFARAGPELREEIRTEVKGCRTGEIRVTQGHNLPARYVIHTVGPKYNVKYQSAAENTLHFCYRGVLQKAVELNLSTIALCVINSVRRNYPPDEGAHIALQTMASTSTGDFHGNIPFGRKFGLQLSCLQLFSCDSCPPFSFLKSSILPSDLVTLGTVRRFLEQYGNSLDAVVLVVENVDVGIYEVLLPLYFPRSIQEEETALWQLPVNVGGPDGEPVLPDRQIRIIDNPQHDMDADETVDLSCQLESSVTVGEHAFSQMQGDLDQQRLLGERPQSDPIGDIMIKEMQNKERYERLLRRAKTEDLSEVSGIGCLYQSGVDRFGRPVIVFIGKWFRFREINLDKALLYLIYLLDPLVKSDYVITYFHTLTTSANHPSLSWLREVYNVLPYKYKKNLKAFYIIHPTFWTKMTTWWFTTFMAPAIKQKVHSLPGVEYLYSAISPDQLEIPAYITEYDMSYVSEAKPHSLIMEETKPLKHAPGNSKVNGLRYFQPESPT